MIHVLVLVTSSSPVFFVVVQAAVVILLIDYAFLITLMAFPFFFFSNSYDQTCDESCIVFASLYGKPRTTRNGNKSEINSRWWKNSWEIPRTNCTQFPGKEIKLYAISRNGNYLCIFFRSWELRAICTRNFQRIFPQTEIYLGFISVSDNTRFCVQTGKNDARLFPRLHPFFAQLLLVTFLDCGNNQGRHGCIISTGRRRPNRGGVTRTGGTPGRHYVGSPTGPPPPQCPPPPPPPVPTVPPSIVVTLLQRGDHHGSAAAPCVTGRVRIRNGSHSRSYSTRTTRERGRCNIRRPTTRSTVCYRTQTEEVRCGMSQLGLGIRSRVVVQSLRRRPRPVLSSMAANVDRTTESTRRVRKQKHRVVGTGVPPDSGEV